MVSVSGPVVCLVVGCAGVSWVGESSEVVWRAFWHAFAFIRSHSPVIAKYRGDGRIR